MANSEFPLSLVIKAVDKATEPLRKINQRINKFTAPVRKLNNSFAALSAEAGFPKLIKGFQGVGSAAGKVGSAAFALGTKFAALAGVAGFALFNIVKGAVDAGDKLSEMAQRTGLSVDAYAQLGFAAAQADVDQDQFNSSMDQFNKRLGQMKAGTGPLLAFLKKVSPELAKQVSGAKNTEEAFGLMQLAFEKVTDKNKRAALGDAIFGKGGKGMGEFLGQGTEEIKAQRAEFLRLSGSQQEFADNSSALDNAMKKTGVAFMGLRNTAAGALFPALTDLSDALTEIVASNRGDIKKWATEAGAALSGWIKGGGLTRVVETLKEFGRTLKTAVDFLGGFKGVAILAGAVMAGPLLSAIVGLGGALATLGSTLIANPPLAGLLVTALALAAAGKAIHDNWEPLKEFFSGNGGTSTLNHQMAAFDVNRKYSEYEKANGLNGYSLGAEKAFSAQKAKTASVDVNFKNPPPGTKFSPSKDSAGFLNLSYGFSMVTP